MPPCPSHCSYTNSIQSRFPLDSAVSLFKSKDRLTASFQNVEVGKAFFPVKLKCRICSFMGADVYWHFPWHLQKKQSSESSTEFVLHLSILSWEAWQILLGVFRLASLFWPRAGDGVSSTSSSWTLCFRLSDGKSCWCDETFLEKNITCYMMLHVPFSSHCDVYRGVSFQHNGWTATFLALAVYTCGAISECHVWVLCLDVYRDNGQLTTKCDWEMPFLGAIFPCGLGGILWMRCGAWAHGCICWHGLAWPPPVWKQQLSRH